VLEACVVGIPHPHYQERPLALVRLSEEGPRLSKQDIYAALRSRVAKWWLPDQLLFVDEIPKSTSAPPPRPFPTH
jgi:fatty-acyl-CoA synthase